QDRDPAQGDQYVAAAAAARNRARELGILSHLAGAGSPQGEKQQYSPAADPGATVRVLRRLLRLWRNPVFEIAFAAIWRPGGHCKRDRLFLDLWRESSHHSVDQECRGPRPCLVELPVRRQRRV